MLDTPTTPNAKPHPDAQASPPAEAEQIDAIRRYEFRRLDVEHEMTTLDGLISALHIVRWCDDLVDFSDAAARRKQQAALEGLFAVIDSTVTQAEKLSRIIHRTEAEPNADDCCIEGDA